jgi:putative phosphoribosyl transferase
MLFKDREDAGRRLAAELLAYREQRPVVLALPRGGVPVGFEIAKALNAPLDVVLVRKIGAPWMPELAVGAIAEGEPIEKIIERETVAELGVPQKYLDEEIARQTSEIERRQQLYRKTRPRSDIKGCTAIVVDDGIATGATMRAALRAVRREGPSKLVLAVPVAPASTLAKLRSEVSDIVCLSSPEDFGAISVFYADFHQVDDAVVIELLAQAAARATGHKA